MLAPWKRLAAAAGLAVVASVSTAAPGHVHAFPHVVQPGQSVAELAEVMYGRVELERVIVAANGLEGRRGNQIVPGMRLEIPSVGHTKILPGDTWRSIARTTLGDGDRADVLAHFNDSHPWLVPAIGLEIVVPFNLRYVASRGDTTQSVAYRFLGDRNDAWIVASYNRLDRAKLRQGEILLIPLVDLPLTDAGREAARTAGALVRSEAGGGAREAQQRAAAEIPRLVQAVRRGRWIDAIARGASLLALENLAEPQLAAIHRQLLEAYVALGETGRATTACERWRQADPAAPLDPIDLSPKIIDVCVADEEPLPGAPGVVGRPMPEGAVEGGPR